MAQNISLLGADYSDVPAVQLPKTGGGTASFTDVTDTTAAAGDVVSGKYIHLATGERVQGTLANGSATTPATTITASPTISVSSSGLITATNNKTQSVTPTVSAGYVASGTAGTITVDGSNTKQLTTQSTSTKYPSTSDQTISSGRYITGTQTFKAVKLSSTLTAENIKKDVVVTVGDASNASRITSITGTYEASGGTSYTLLKSQDVTVNTTSTSAATVATISCGTSAWTKDKILYVKVRDKAGKRNGYFLGSDMYLFNRQNANGGTTTVNNACRIAHSVDSSGNYAFYVSQTTNGYGVYGYSVSTAGAVVIQSRYHASNSLTINGTYNVQVYLLDYAPTQGNPYNYSFS